MNILMLSTLKNIIPKYRNHQKQNILIINKLSVSGTIIKVINPFIKIFLTKQKLNQLNKNNLSLIKTTKILNRINIIYNKNKLQFQIQNNYKNNKISFNIIINNHFANKKKILKVCFHQKLFHKNRINFRFRNLVNMNFH